jgi:hypothetical protein
MHSTRISWRRSTYAPAASCIRACKFISNVGAGKVVDTRDCHRRHLSANGFALFLSLSLSHSSDFFSNRRKGRLHEDVSTIR